MGRPLGLRLVSGVVQRLEMVKGFDFVHAMRRLDDSDGDDARLTCAVACLFRVAKASHWLTDNSNVTTLASLFSGFVSTTQMDPLIKATMAASNQSVWIVRYGLTKFPLQENVGPYDSK